MLSSAEQQFLDTREICCDGVCECANSNRVNCFVEPCLVVTCDEAFTTCVNNFCGGCLAEFFDVDGNIVCKP